MTAEVNGKISLYFGWKGATNSSRTKGLDIGIVDLVFKNVKGLEVSVNLPEKLPLDKMQQLPFTMITKQAGLTRTEYPEVLQVSVDAIKSLRVNAGFFQPNPNKGPAIMDESGKIRHATGLLRSDRHVKLELPPKLEIGGIYCLQISSDKDLHLEARLVKQEKAASDSVDSLQILAEALLPEIEAKLMTMTTQLGFQVNLDKERALRIEEIRGQLSIIKKETLDKLCSVSKERLTQACLDAIGKDGLNILLLKLLRPLIENPAPSEVEMGVPIRSIKKEERKHSAEGHS